MLNPPQGGTFDLSQRAVRVDDRAGINDQVRLLDRDGPIGPIDTHAGGAGNPR